MQRHSLLADLSYAQYRREYWVAMSLRSHEGLTSIQFLLEASCRQNKDIIGCRILDLLLKILMSDGIIKRFKAGEPKRI